MQTSPARVSFTSSRFALILLAWCALACLGAGAAETPALRNPGFEEGLAGWHPMPGGSLAADQGQGRTGEVSVRITGAEGQNPWIAQGLGEIQPHAVYSARAYVRRDSGTGQAALKLEFYDAQNRYLEGCYGLAPPDLTAEWAVVQVQAEAPEGAAKAAVLLRLIGPGTLHFDDAAFSLVQAPPVLLLGTSRVVVPAQVGTTVTLRARLLAQLPAGELKAVMSGGALGEPMPLAVEMRPSGVADYDLLLTLPPGVKPGVYRLQLAWPNTPSVRADLILLPSGSRPALISAEGRFLSGEEAATPLGVYHAEIADFAKVAAAGFNLVEIAPPADLEELQAAATAATAQDLRLLVPLYPALASAEGADALVGMVGKMAESPAVFGWLLADEPESKPAAAAAIPELYLRLRQADPRHPVFLNLGRPATVAEWAPLADALLVSLLPTVTETPETVGGQIVAAGQALAVARKPWLGVLPAGWTGRPALSEDQARTYLYQLLAAGAQGVMYFSLREGKWDLSATGLWKVLPALNAEARELGAALAAGQPLEGVEVSVKEVTLRAVRRGDLGHLLLLNPLDQRVTGYLRVPEPVAQANYVDGKGKVEVKNRTLKFELPARGARALRVSFAAPTAPPAAPGP